jgi:hypothetical protein
MYPISKNLDFTFLQYLDGSNSKVNKTPKQIDNSSILGFIESDKNFQDFLTIVRIADFGQDLSCNLKHMTLFLPIDCSRVNLLTLDKLEARKIVMLSLLPSILYERDLITGLFDTYLRNYQLWIEKGVINDKSVILQYNIKRSNGLIHVIDKLPF